MVGWSDVGRYSLAPAQNRVCRDRGLYRLVTFSHSEPVYSQPRSVLDNWAIEVWFVCCYPSLYFHAARTFCRIVELGFRVYIRIHITEPRNARTSQFRHEIRRKEKKI